MPELRVGGVPSESFQSIALAVGPVERTVASMIRTEQNLERGGNRRDAAKLNALRLFYNTRIREIAVATAAVMEEEARSHLNSTQRRPDSERGGPKLVDLIKAEAWDLSTTLAFGWVSMGLHVELDKAVNPKTGGIYWRVQEWGYQYRHTPKGFFLAGPGYSGSATRPNAAQSGLHPLFIASGKGGKFRKPPRLIARHYLKAGAAAGVSLWQREMRQFDHEFARKYQRLTVEIFGAQLR